MKDMKKIIILVFILTGAFLFLEDSSFAKDKYPDTLIRIEDIGFSGRYEVRSSFTFTDGEVEIEDFIVIVIDDENEFEIIFETKPSLNLKVKAFRCHAEELRQFNKTTNEFTISLNKPYGSLFDTRSPTIGTTKPISIPIGIIYNLSLIFTKSSNGEITAKGQGIVKNLVDAEGVNATPLITEYTMKRISD